MKRFHVHVSVNDLDASIRFYSALFGAQPTVHKDDYAKWMVEDPRLNFAISQRGSRTAGINHLGLQVDSDEELEALRTQARAADFAAVAEKGVNCCYATGNKYWFTDPAGVAWETYHTLGQIEFFGDEQVQEAVAEPSALPCCVPAAAPKAAAQTPTACCR
jgi:catechol 2,3-dioxygenase-like lactoylglutathione lyase family enzyme